MGTEALFRRYQELQAYAGWTEASATRVQAVAGLLEPYLPALVDDFYAEISKHADALKVITGGAEQIGRLKQTLLTWLRELLSGRYDEAYAAQRWRVGFRHVEIGLDQVYVVVALSRLRHGLLDALRECWRGEMAEAWATRTALDTLIDLDLALIEDAYQAEYTARQQRAERQAIGQMIAGVAHESRNALARIQACLEMLALEVEDRPDALDLIQRLQRAHNDLHRLFEELRSYAAPLKLERDVWDLSGVWRQAWANLSIQYRSRPVALHEHAHGVSLRLNIDAFRMEQVFRNILDNALAACPDPVRIDIRCAEATLGDRPAVRVAVCDNGPGLSAEVRRRIFDAFFTTKAKGTGLGMAIAQRIVEAHGGEIGVGPDAGAGAEIRITLPRGPA